MKYYNIYEEEKTGFFQKCNCLSAITNRLISVALVLIDLLILGSGRESGKQFHHPLLLTASTEVIAGQIKPPHMAAKLSMSCYYRHCVA